MSMREAVERALEEWSKNVWEWLLLNQESHHLVPELIITNKILKNLASVSWKLCQDDIPIDKLVTWAGYRIYGTIIPGNKSVERVIRDAYQEALKKEEEKKAERAKEKRRIRAEKRAEKIFATTGKIVKIRVPRPTDSGNSPHAPSPSRTLFPSLDSDPEDSIYIPVEVPETALDVEDEDEDVFRQIDY